MLDNQKKSERQGCTSVTELFNKLVVTGLFAFGLTACQTDGPPTLSLEEAKKATASFEGQSFTPPPKTIDDITSILKSQRDIKPEELEQNTRITKASPPKDASSSNLAQFYFKRAVAADEIGNSKQLIADLKTGLPFAKGLPIEADYYFRHASPNYSWCGVQWLVSMD